MRTDGRKIYSPSHQPLGQDAEMLLMDSLSHHELPVRSPAHGALGWWKLAGRPPIFPDLLREHHLLRKSNLASAIAASFLMLKWHYHNNSFFLLFLILFHGDSENQGDSRRIQGTFMALLAPGAGSKAQTRSLDHAVCAVQKKTE